jgi:GTP cyclohydrolase I
LQAKGATLDKLIRNNQSASRVRRSTPERNNQPADGVIDQQRIQNAVREILLAIGEDTNREGLRGTPERVARLYAEMFSGLKQNPRDHLKKTFTQKYDEMVLVKDIGFESMCEHHLLPFLGKAHIAYLPKGKIVGLSKLARVVEVLARRPQVQERMTEQIADLVVEELDARGVAVILEASHTCMTIRGIRKATSICTTSAMRGAFALKESTRAELMALVYGSR